MMNSQVITGRLSSEFVRARIALQAGVPIRRNRGVTPPVGWSSSLAPSRYQTGAESKNRLGGRGVCRGDY